MIFLYSYIKRRAGAGAAMLVAYIGNPATAFDEGFSPPVCTIDISRVHIYPCASTDLSDVYMHLCVYTCHGV